MKPSTRPWIFVSLLLTPWATGVSAFERPASALADAPFSQEFCQTQIRSSEPSRNDVRAVAVANDGKVWVATAAGVFFVEGNQLVAPEGEAIDGPTYDVTVDETNSVWVAAWNGVYRIRNNRLEPIGQLQGPLTALATMSGDVIAAGPNGIFSWFNDQWQQRDVAVATTIRDVAILPSDEECDVTNCPLAVATGIGLYLIDGDKVRRIASHEEIQSSDVRTVAVHSHGELWVGCATGIDVYKRGQRLRSITAGDGLPSADVRHIAFDRADNAWVGTNLGVTRQQKGGWSLRHSRRWLPHDEVRQVAFSPNGTTWIATADGISAIARRRMTLADKAEYYEALVQSRHVRPPGLVERCRLGTPGDLSSYQAMDTDNDGSYTGMYVAAEAFRYAATGDKNARNNATAAFQAIDFLHQVTESDGFFARTVVPATWERMADPNRTYTLQQIAEDRAHDARFKRVEVRWRPSSDGLWLWKGDTSSDEVTGHYFTFGVYYDLVANEEQKQHVADRVRQLTDYIIAGGYVLRDQDGHATRWGVWSPEKLNHDPNWRLDRGVNSVEILSFLLTAHHVTGDDRYLAELQSLYDDHGYRENILHPQQLDPGSFTYIDSELLAMAYRGLITYAVDPQRKKVYEQSLEAWFAPVRNDASPFYGFTYAALGGRGDFRPKACLAQLRDIPLDMVQWTVDNRHREDIRLVRAPSSEHWQTDRLLPASERSVSRWDRNPYEAVRGDGGTVEGSSVYWLLPYWMGRYHTLVSSPQSP